MPSRTAISPRSCPCMAMQIAKAALDACFALPANRGSRWRIAKGGTDSMNDRSAERSTSVLVVKSGWGALGHFYTDLRVKASNRARMPAARCGANPVRVPVFTRVLPSCLALPSPFGSTRSQVRILSPRLTSQGLHGPIRAESRVAGPDPQRFYTEPSVRLLATRCGACRVFHKQS